MIKIDINKVLEAAGGKMELDLNLTIQRGELITLYGESGAGKTSTLRILSGLMKPDTGRIIVNDTVWFDSEQKISLKPQKRKIGFVFQDYALFSHMTVRENLEFALQKGQERNKINELIDITELGALQERKPDSLSGGQKQRVALARALVQQPELLLLDEPLAALDPKIRFKLQDYILDVHREFGLTTLLVSHDIGEIIKLSDRVCMIDDGKITNIGPPEDIFINKQISGKFKFTGDVLKIQKRDVIYVVTVGVQSNVVKVVVQEDDVKNLSVGDKVVIASKAFNPVLYKIES